MPPRTRALHLVSLVAHLSCTFSPLIVGEDLSRFTLAQRQSAFEPPAGACSSLPFRCQVELETLQSAEGCLKATSLLFVIPILCFLDSTHDLLRLRDFVS